MIQEQERLLINLPINTGKFSIDYANDFAFFQLPLLPGVLPLALKTLPVGRPERTKSVMRETKITRTEEPMRMMTTGQWGSPMSLQRREQNCPLTPLR